MYFLLAIGLSVLLTRPGLLMSGRRLRTVVWFLGFGSAAAAIGVLAGVLVGASVLGSLRGAGLMWTAAALQLLAAACSVVGVWGMLRERRRGAPTPVGRAALALASVLEGTQLLFALVATVQYGVMAAAL